MNLIRIFLPVIFVCTALFAAPFETEGSEALEAPVDPNALTGAEVEAIVQAAVTAVNSDGFSVGVVDRAGRPLAMWQKPGATLETAEWALSLARTGAFFSNNQAPLSSRTIRFISGIHFPPGIPFQPGAALYGIENTNRGCDLNAEFNPGKSLPPAQSLQAFFREEGLEEGPPLSCNALDTRGCGVGITTGKYSGSFENGRLVNVPLEEIFDQRPFQVHGGGMPLFRDTSGGQGVSCEVVGGVGVFGIDARSAEYAALVSILSTGFGPLPCLPAPGAVYLEGIRLPFVAQVTRPPGTQPDSLRGHNLLEPRPGGVAPEGWLVGGPENPLDSPELSSEEVQRIVQQALDQANQTRASIRLPLGSRTRMVIAVSDREGNLLAMFRMPDATVFSVDVAVAKSRNVVYFSSDRFEPADLPWVPAGTSITNRTISFGSQPLYPIGIDFSSPGPFFDLFIRDLANPCSQGFDQEHLSNINGVVFFPGSVPLYKDGRLVGGLGVSGDGVEQDDLVSHSGSRGFEAPFSIQADQIFVQGVRLPYLKFNRNPEK